MQLTLEPSCLSYFNRPIVVGLSGGRDSVALLHLLQQKGYELHAVHVHHGIRGAEADGDADFCRELCARTLWIRTTPTLINWLTMFSPLIHTQQSTTFTVSWLKAESSNLHPRSNR